jgi:hypothetical protein
MSDGQLCAVNGRKCAWALFTVCDVRAEEIVVIVNVAAATISKEQIADLYLGRSDAWTPIDQAVGSEESDRP